MPTRSRVVPADLVMVRFRLEQDESDWPPTSSEGVWAVVHEAGIYELGNVPWFALGVACGDRVRAAPDEEGVLWVTESLSWSGRYTVRVIPLGDESSEVQLQQVIDAFVPLGAECEGALPAFKLVALDIPPDAQLYEIKTLLLQGEADGRWGYDEGCVDETWRAL